MSNVFLDSFSAWPAPAKINLFLHITGRRADGYHELQTVFQLLDWGDTVYFRLRDDEQIVRLNPIDGVLPEADLSFRAANLLRQAARLKSADTLLKNLGVDIRIEKIIPLGGGLGGGSSDAATTLVALNQLWQAKLSVDELAMLGLQLGADVPVFVREHSAFAQGIGDQICPISINQVRGDAWFVIIQPKINVPTAQIFASPQLTRNTSPVKMRDLVSGTLTRNDLEPVARSLYPQVDQALNWLNQFGLRYGGARMSGSGACGFIQMCDAKTAFELAATPSEFGRLIAVHGIDVSPLLAAREGRWTGWPKAD